ncbi:OmpW family protein [Kordiimonas sp. SCSIO 12610]|uniref:OmpW/AlkL family protein n=1 Tax=Kordiimonas sp. SCSIO 12610 TaxID=2829597 RepID=UPI0021093180|nr:OmpW family outer membrane protein [Kordiimonas sp. SCSIO 12610]UTW54590.1 OmpW family protein [Kordiimonas sp. SCSIO 12610]
MKLSKPITAFLACTMLTGSVFADAGDWLVRLRGIYVVPDEAATIDPIGGSAQIDNTFVPELDFSYFVTDKIALELILATNRHSPIAAGTAAGDVPLGSVNLLPPTLTAQYHPLAGETFSPYIGAGVNYTVFFNVDEPAAVVDDIDYSNSFGFALQAGFDVKLDEKWVFNVDVKRLWLDTDVSINGDTIKADVDIDPWIIGAGFGFKF